MLWIGLLSGTSADGADAALAEIEVSPGAPPRLIGQRAFATFRFSDELRARILRVSESEAPPLEELLALDGLLGEAFALAAMELVQEAGLAIEDVQAIGSHGQTVRHLPGRRNQRLELGHVRRELALASTLQIGDPSIIAERTGRPTIARFRQRDLAAGGQGAPLVPAFHLSLLEGVMERSAIVNVGGIANITLPATEQSPALAFDTGPGNMVIDALVGELIAGGTGWDEGGALAASGRAHEGLLATLLADPYFALAPPKSTGRERFGAPFAGDLLARAKDMGLSAPDILATATALTAASIAGAIAGHGPKGGLERLFVCGGGIHNQSLLKMLSGRLPRARIESTSALGYEPDAIEALAFAYLAAAHETGWPGNLPSATGARHLVILGERTPGKTEKTGGEGP